MRRKPRTDDWIDRVVAFGGKQHHKRRSLKKGRITLGLAVLSLITLTASTSLADYTVYYSPLNWSTRDASLDVRPAAQDAAILVMTNATGPLKWLKFGLTLSGGDPIDAVTICYTRSDDSESYIGQIRLNMMTIPSTALVIHDDATPLMDPGPTCYYSDVIWSDPAEGTITLKLGLFFNNVNDWIEIGMIALDFREPLNGLNDEQPILGGDHLQLRQNHPNPFNPSTVISYVLDHEGPVEVRIHDLSGRLVRELLREDQEIGEYQIIWDGRDDLGNEMPAGKYFYRVQVDHAVGSRGMILIR